MEYTKRYKRILIFSCNPEQLLKSHFREYNCTIDVRKPDAAAGALMSRDYAAILCFDETVSRKNEIINPDSIRFSNTKIPFIMTCERPADLKEQDATTEYQTLTIAEKTLEKKKEMVDSIIRRLGITKSHVEQTQQLR